MQIVNWYRARASRRTLNVALAARDADPGKPPPPTHFGSISPIFPAEHARLTFTLLIVGDGQLAPNGSEGELRTGGEMEFLQLDVGQVFWREQRLEIAQRANTAQSAQTFNKAFAESKGDFALGELVGILSFMAQGP